MGAAETLPWTGPRSDSGAKKLPKGPRELPALWPAPRPQQGAGPRAPGALSGVGRCTACRCFRLTRSPSVSVLLVL